MASRHQRRKRAAAKKASIQTERIAAFVSHERAKAVKRNLATDNRPTATVRNHLGIARVIHTNAYSGITDSFVRMVEGGGMRECLNLDRPQGMSDRQLDCYKARVANKG